MPKQDVIKMHYTAAEKDTFKTLITQMQAILQPKLINLSKEENKKFGRINEKHKLFVNKVWDYRKSQPKLSSEDVDWVEFEADFDDRKFLEGVAMQLEGLLQPVMETKRLHDYDNFNNAQIDYRFAKYKKGTEKGLGFDTKAEVLRQFFPTSNSKKTKENKETPKNG